MDLWTTILVFGSLTPAIISAIVGSMKGRGFTGFLLGLFLSWIGFIITLCLSNERAREERHVEMMSAVGGYKMTRVRCPHCRALVDENAKFCPECGGAMT